MKKLQFIGASALAVLAVSLASGGRASTLTTTETGSVPPTQANWSSTLSFPQFDTDLGTLMAVTLSVNESVSSTLTAGNLSNTVLPSEASSGSASTVAQFSLQDSGGSLSGLPQISLTSPYSLSPGGSQSWSLSAADSGNITYTNPFILNEFSGSGNISLSAAGTAFTNQINSGGASYATQSTDSGLIAEVTYTYSAVVPEPSACALLGAGIAALLAFRPKRRK